GLPGELGGFGEIVAEPCGRAERRAAASSVAPGLIQPGRSLRPCIATPIASARRAPFCQTLLGTRCRNGRRRRPGRRGDARDVDGLLGEDLVVPDGAGEA